MSDTSNTHVVVCIPYFRCQPYIRRAVKSILEQTHNHLTLVVINDGDTETPPWPELNDIDDPRLVRFDLVRNRGPYFALQVVLDAIPAPYLLMQDADDLSDRERVSHLVAAMEKEHADFAFSSQPQYRQQQNGAYARAEVRWEKYRTDADSPGTPFLVDDRITPEFRYRAPHAGLWRTASLRALGGYYGGFRISSDVLLTNSMLMAGKVTHVPLPLYHRFIRPESLTHAPETGNQSAYAAGVRSRMATLYEACYAHYTLFIAGAISGAELTAGIRAVRTGTLSAEDRKSLAAETGRLRQLFPNL